MAKVNYSFYIFQDVIYDEAKNTIKKDGLELPENADLFEDKQREVTTAEIGRMWHHLRLIDRQTK